MQCVLDIFLCSIVCTTYRAHGIAHLVFSDRATVVPLANHCMNHCISVSGGRLLQDELANANHCIVWFDTTNHYARYIPRLRFCSSVCSSIFSQTSAVFWGEVAIIQSSLSQTIVTILQCLRTFLAHRSALLYPSTCPPVNEERWSLQ